MKISNVYLKGKLYLKRGRGKCQKSHITLQQL